MKNWLIKKLGGFTAEQVDEAVNEAVNKWVDLVDVYKTVSIDVSETLRNTKEELHQAQLELERAKDWRNHVAKSLRQNKIPRHIVNRLMEMLK